jgi:ABC-2 type transport system ATP-binding protein
MSININKVNKFYGKQQALTDVSFSLNKGEIVGFLGPNGAGKSTLMKIITCYLEQDSGKVQVCDLDTIEQNLKVKAKIGYLPEHNPLYTDMYIKEYLTFVGRIYKVENLNNRIDEIISQTGLTPEQSKKIGALSKGFKQRVGLAAALIHNPEILILDEPTTGLDPNQLVEIRNLIKEVGKDKTVLLSTHIMQEVDKMCNRVIIINKGKIVDDKLISNYHKNNIDLEEHFRKLTA